MTIENNAINLKEYDGFLNEEQCRIIISIGEPEMKKAEVLGEDQNDFRIADTMFFDPNLKALKRIREVIAKQTGIPVENQEAVSIIRYTAGGIFQAHHDCFSPSADYFEKAMEQGGQRVKTCLIYLNENFEGGQTEFPNMNYRVTPKTGKLIYWDNIDRDGNIIPESLHAGLSVVSGVKYLLSIWIREKAFVSGHVKYD